MWISERKGLLCTFFSLLALHAARISLKEKSPFYLMAYYILFSIALLAKMTTVLLPVWLMGWEFLIEKRKLRETSIRHILPIFVAFLLGLVRLSAAIEMASRPHTGFWNLDRLIGLPLRISNALGFYIRMFFWPFPQSIRYASFELDKNILLNVMVLLLFALFIFMMARRRPCRKKFVMLVGLFLFPLIPVLQIIPSANHLNDRYLYFPIIGLAGLTVTAIQQLFGNISTKIWSAAWVTLCIFIVPVTFNRSSVWTSNEALWRDTIEKSPWSALSFLNFGLEMENQNRYNEAISAFEKALQLDAGPEVSTKALISLGLIYSTPELPLIYDPIRADGYLQRVQLPTANKMDNYLFRFGMARTKFGLKNIEAVGQMESLSNAIDQDPDPNLSELRGLISRTLNSWKR